MNLVSESSRLPSMSPAAIDRVRVFEAKALLLEQTELQTQHVLHGGMYARTIVLPTGTFITGALIKKATMLIIQGHVIIHIGDKSIELEGYNVVPASSNRKQAFMAIKTTWMTMLFPSEAKVVSVAEEEFTDEAHTLISRKQDAINHIIVTGE